MRGRKDILLRHALSSSMRLICTSLTYLAFIEHRKIMYIPFPFPHAQLSTFYTVVMVLVIPFLMDQYVSIDGISMVWVGCLLTFLTVTCLVGLHEVSRELENPFRNVPNDLPLVTLHAMYNAIPSNRSMCTSYGMSCSAFKVFGAKPFWSAVVVVSSHFSTGTRG